MVSQNLVVLIEALETRSGKERAETVTNDVSGQTVRNARADSDAKKPLKKRKIQPQPFSEEDLQAIQDLASTLPLDGNRTS